MSITPVRDPSGAITNFIAIKQDVTQRRATEAASRSSKSRLEDVQHIAPLGSWELDVQASQFRGSDIFFRILDWTPGAAALPFGQVLDAIPSADRERVNQTIKNTLQTHEPFDVEHRVMRRDGTMRIVRSRGQLVVDQGGRSVRLVGTAHDITDYRLAHQKLRQSEEKFRSLVANIPDVIWSSNVDGRTHYISPNAERVFGFPPEEMCEKGTERWVGRIYPSDSERIVEAFHRLFAGGRAFDVEYRLQRKDGEWIWVHDRAYRTYERDGVRCADGVLSDITARKRAEEEMRKAKEAAEAANRAKSQFLANMSHEIRTPMNGVIGAAGLLLDTQLTPEQRQYAEIVRASGEALLKVINDILDFSKIEARKLTLETTDFDLRAVLEDAVAVLALKASEKRLELTCEIEPGTPTLLRGDPFRVRQVLVNLLGNAVKFTSQGKVEVRARLEAEEACTATLRFTVRDTGIGFRQDRASTLFEPFVQADGSSTRRYGGTGLGLTISKQLVEMMGGQIGVQSQEGRGSTFSFTGVFEKQTQSSTRMIAAGNAEALSATLAHSQPTAAGANSQARVLLAEDNLTNQAVAKAMLNKLGYHADVVADGEEALQALREADYDLVLMDCGMPEMDGYAATRCIRAGPAGARNPHIPIVALTADAMSGDRDQCLAAGMNDYLAKPVDLRKLADALEKWLNAPASTGELSLPGSHLLAKTETVFNQAVFHQEELLARLMGDKDLSGKILAGFLDDAPRQLRTLKKMLEEGDADGARRQAHSLKGAAATISAEALRSLCSEAQEAAAASELIRALALLPRLEEQFELFKATLKQSGWV